MPSTTYAWGVRANDNTHCVTSLETHVSGRDLSGQFTSPRVDDDGTFQITNDTVHAALQRRSRAFCFIFPAACSLGIGGWSIAFDDDFVTFVF